MKQISIFFGIVFFITGCAQTDYDYKTENIILDCFYQHHKDADIDVKSSIDKIENILLKHKILEDKSGESYIRIIERIRDNNDLDINNPDLLTDIKSIDYIPSSVFCRDTSYASLLDSASLTDSKFKYVIGIFDSIRVKGNISPTLIAEEILEVFNTHDFENDYYRTIGLVMFANMIKMNDHDYGVSGGLTRKLPRLEENEPVEPQNIFVILINSEDKILANGQIVRVSELKPLVKKFLLETSDKIEVDLPLIGKQKTSKGIISLKNDIGTSYKFYMTVQTELITIYKEIRDMYSQRFFQSDFDNLGKEKQKIIKDLVPQRISEAEPGT
jgi:hypothetical protein